MEISGNVDAITANITSDRGDLTEHQYKNIGPIEYFFRVAKAIIQMI